MHAKRLSLDFHTRAVDRDHSIVESNIYRAIGGETRVADHRIVARSRNEGAVRHVGTVDERFARDREAQRSSLFFQRATRKSQHDKGRVELVHTPGHNHGKFVVRRNSVVQRAMRLDVEQRRAFRRTTFNHQLELSQQRADNCRHTQIELAPSESLAIGITRMRSDADVAFERRGNGPTHHLDGPRMRPAGDAGRRYDVEERSVTGVSLTVVLADVGIEIDGQFRSQ